jgi:hypothetical protein
MSQEFGRPQKIGTAKRVKLKNSILFLDLLLNRMKNKKS